MEPFLSGVGLVFLLWEQPVVARVASPSPVVLVDFSFLARPDLCCWDISQVAMPWAGKQNTMWFHGITGPWQSGRKPLDLGQGAGG